jgi:transposase
MLRFSPQKVVYHKSYLYETEYSEEAKEKEKKLKKYKELTDAGCDQKTALKVLEISKSSYYRWRRDCKLFGIAGLENESRAPKKKRGPKWTAKDELLVLKIRLINPFYGKNKIKEILSRDYGINMSRSRVGRIISKLIKKNKIQRVRFHMGLDIKKKRVFDDHAKRWTYGMKAKNPGELIQMDHATIKLDCGKIVKHFNAICPITKLTAEKAYVNATSNTASDFLIFARENFPFKIKSIQVDGGSEFMGSFEALCKQKGIELYVLPPRSPKFNAHVERNNETVKYEFYHSYSGPATLSILNDRLQAFVKNYNTYRPHQSLNYKTPMAKFISIADELNGKDNIINQALSTNKRSLQIENHTVLQ